MSERVMIGMREDLLTDGVRRLAAPSAAAISGR
jgi:hypothetical protein